MTNTVTAQPTVQPTVRPTVQPAAPVHRFPDPRPDFAKALATCRQVVAGVSPRQLDLATPCLDFDVRTLGQHVIAVLERLVIVGSGGDLAGSADFADGVADTDWVAAFDESAAQVEAVWSDDAVLTNILTVPWTKLPGAIALLIYINEITVHAWDLATATNQDVAWDEDVLSTAYDAIQRGLPAGGRVENGFPFAEVVPVGDDAPLIEQLVAWNGRRP